MREIVSFAAYIINCGKQFIEIRPFAVEDRAKKLSRVLSQAPCRCALPFFGVTLAGEHVDSVGRSLQQPLQLRHIQRSRAIAM
jgi:hypothetical protein